MKKLLIVFHPFFGRIQSEFFFCINFAEITYEFGFTVESCD